MPVVDYQAAWVQLQEYVASKTSHGRSDLLVRMAEVAADNRVPEDLLDHAARLMGRPIPTYKTNEPEAGSAVDPDRRIEGDMGGDHRPPTDRGGHDGSKQHSGVT